MSLKKTSSFMREFKIRLSGSRVRSADKALKKMNAMANENGHAVYTAASKKPLGWSITPRHEQFRNTQVMGDDKQKRLFEAMSKAQVQRKSASRDTNRARLALGGMMLGAAGVTAGGTLLAKKMYEKKKQKEQEEAYYKTAGDKNIIGGIKNGLQVVKNNFAPAAELSESSAGNFLTRLKNVATFKTVRDANQLLSHFETPRHPYKLITDTRGNKAREKLNSLMETVIKADRIGAGWDAEKKKNSIDVNDYQAQAEHIMSKRSNKNWDDPTYWKKKSNVERIEANQKDLVSAIKPIRDELNNRRSKIHSTRNNALAESIGFYAIPVAATAGGIMLYKRHKKKKKQKEQENKNQVK